MKFRILLFLSKLIRGYVKLKGAEVKSSAFFTGIPFVKVHPQGSLTIGENVTIHSMKRANPVMNLRTTLDVNAPNAHLGIGKNVGISGSTIICTTRITIGDNTLIGADSMLLDNNLHFPGQEWGWKNTYRSSQKGKPITIGKGCFVGARAIILKGVTLGDGVIVAAGSVVTRDVPEGFMAIGNPAVNKPLPLNYRRDAQGNALNSD
ncbi:MAG: acyltransferase [Akkermansia sp.]